MNQHPDDSFDPPPLPETDILVLHTPGGHRLFVPRSRTGFQYVIDEIQNQPGRLLPCLLLPASWEEPGIFVEMAEDGVRWTCRESRPPT